jgi:hypothetical protein
VVWGWTANHELEELCRDVMDYVLIHDFERRGSLVMISIGVEIRLLIKGLI